MQDIKVLKEMLWNLPAIRQSQQKSTFIKWTTQEHHKQPKAPIKNDLVKVSNPMIKGKENIKIKSVFENIKTLNFFYFYENIFDE